MNWLPWEVSQNTDLMKAWVVLFIFLLMLAAPRLFTFGSAQAPSDQSRFYGPDIPDTVSPFPGETAENMPVYNPSVLFMIQELLSGHEVLMEFFPTDSLIFILTVTREAAGINIARTGPGFWQDVRLFQNQVRQAVFNESRKRSEQISIVLLSQVAKYLKGKTRAVIIARNCLHAFPFDLLVVPGSTSGQHSQRSSYLIEKMEIVCNNSISQWLRCRLRDRIIQAGPHADKSPSFVGFSPGFDAHGCIQELHDAGTEVRRIGKMFNEKGMAPVVLLDENSNENNFKSYARSGHIVHLATHSMRNMTNPEMNGLLFHEYCPGLSGGEKDDGLLAIPEICELKIPADLIVLNSCASAKVIGRVGVNWYSCADCFIKAGAGNVLCTLWNVTDHFAERFMVEFYRYYLSGMSFSKALRQAKLRMMSEPSTMLPVNWAAYVLIGS